MANGRTLVAAFGDRAAFASLVLLASVEFGCAGAPAAPFDTFKTTQITAYRLQNYEPAPQAATPAPSTGVIPWLPPEISSWVTAGASMLPPWLRPPGVNGATTAAPQADTVPRFHGFRVIGMPTNVIDERLRQEIIDIFGFEKNFDSTHGNCIYAEFGFSFARVSQPPADILVSLSCDQVQAQDFMWPHRYTGLTSDSSRRIVSLTSRIFGGI